MLPCRAILPFLVTAAAGLGSCGDKIDPIPCPPTKELYTYENSVEMFLSDWCLDCHGPVLSNGATVSFDDYDSARANAARIAERAGVDMPPDAAQDVSFEERCSVVYWLQQGAAEMQEETP